MARIVTMTVIRNQESWACTPAERDEDDGEISWHDKHCTDRLRFYFEFHSKTMGVLPL